MAAERLNIDDFVDYEKEYKAVIQHYEIHGTDLVGRCPFHDDSKNSFSVNLRTGQWHCFAEDISGNFVDFISKTRNISTKDAYVEILKEYGKYEEHSKSEKRVTKPLNIKEYSLAKRLPEQFLRDTCHLRDYAKDKGRDAGVSCVLIPYLDREGREVSYRLRYGDKDFRWKYQAKASELIYGEWKLPEFEENGKVVLVEGESDTQSLWYMGIPALGVPGASTFGTKAKDLVNVGHIYVHKEPDQGGETFYRNVKRGLREAGYPGEVSVFTCGNTHQKDNKYKICKDPSDVFISFGQKEGQEVILDLMKNAGTIDLMDPNETPQPLDPPDFKDYKMPFGYKMNTDGVWKLSEKGDDTCVCPNPIVLTKRLISVDGDEEKLEVAFFRDGRWKYARYPRTVLSQTKNIVQLADLGCMVTSENAKHIVKYLSEFEAANIDNLPKCDSASRLGWQTKNRFLPQVSEDNIIIDVDPALQQIVDAYHSEGVYHEWTDYMDKYRGNNRFRFIMASAFAAPLLKILKQRIFFVYIWGDSKSGKSAALKAGLSAWGDPDRLMMNFNATKVGLERTAALFCDLPLGIDERQLAGHNQESLESIIYMIASGTGRTRGTKSGGLQKTRQWRTVAIATGEEPIATEESQSGVSTRMIEVACSAKRRIFESEKDASLMHQKCSEVYGHTGVDFVKRLLKVDEDELRTKFQEILDYMSDKYSENGGSHVQSVAVVTFADVLIDCWIFGHHDSVDDKGHLYLEEGSVKRAKEMADDIFREMTDNLPMDINDNATECLANWIAANAVNFKENAPTRYGEISEDGQTVWILPFYFNKIMKDNGFSGRKTLDFLQDSGLIETDKHGKRQVVHKFEKRPTRMIKFDFYRYWGTTVPESEIPKKSEEGFMDAESNDTPFGEPVQEKLPF